MAPNVPKSAASVAGSAKIEAPIAPLKASMSAPPTPIRRGSPVRFIQSWNVPTMTVKQLPAEQHAVAFEPAVEDSRPLARLQGREALAAKAFGPKGHQRAVRRAGHWVFVDARVGNEDAARDVLLIASRRDDRHPADSLQDREVG